MSGLLEKLIDEDFGYEHEGRVWGRSSKHNSLVVKEDEQLFFWNSRGIRGNAIDYLVLVRRMSRRSAEQLVAEYSKIIPISSSSVERKEYTPYDKLVDYLWINGRKERSYWYRRLLSDETIDKFRLGFFDGWFTIPLYKNGDFLNFQCRREEPKKMIKLWYDKTIFKPILFNAEILNFTSEVYITEGIVDAMLLTQFGLPSVSKSSGSNHWDNDWYGNFARIKHIYYIADNDKAGEYAARLVSKSLGTERVKVYRFTGKPEKYDAMDYFRDGGKLDDFVNDVKDKSQYYYETEKSNVNKFDRNSARKTSWDDRTWNNCHN